MASVYPKHFFSTHPPRQRRAICFLIMPFHSDYARVHSVVRGTLQSTELNLVCIRGDDLVEANILESILVQLAKSEFVIADLTGRNPNVFYELGIAHCVKEQENVVLLTQRMEDVPFDLSHLRCISYSPCEHGLAELRSSLLSVFAEKASRSFRFKIREGQRFEFGRKLVGHRRNLFTLSFQCPHVGLDCVKLQIHFEEHSIDTATSPLDSQFLFLSEDQSSVRIQHIPWDIHFVQATETEALLSLAAA